MSASNHPSLPGSVPPLLVGRERELTVLRAHVDAAFAGRGSLVLIGGEAGIGKTTLAEALCSEATERGALVVIGRCYESTEPPPYGLWVDLFGRYRPEAGDPPPPPAFAEAGMIGRVASPVLLAAQVREFAAALAAHRPLIIVLEDLHWADQAGLDLLRTLARSVTDLPVLPVATYRADEIGRGHPLYGILPAIVREADALRLDLGPLGDAEVAALVSTRYNLVERDVGRLVPYLQGRAEGNPLFLGELLRALEGERVLAPDGDRWALGDLSATRVPLLLRQMIERRTEPLGDEARRLLGVAAVIGQVVLLPLWQAVGEVDEEALLEAMESATAARIIEERPDGSGVRFVHALIREAVYESVPLVRRRAWHRRIAEELAGMARADPDTVAHHFRQAGDPRMALWLFRAGLRATRIMATATAIDRYEAALAALGNAGRSDRGPFATADENGALAAHIRGMLGNERCRTREYHRGVADIGSAVAAMDALPTEAHAPTVAFLGSSPYPFSSRALLASWLGVTGHFAQALAAAGRAHIFAAQDRPAGSPRAPDIDYTVLTDAHASLGRRDEAYAAYRAGYTAFCDAGLFEAAAVISMHALFWVSLIYDADDLPGRLRLAVDAEQAIARGPIPGLKPRFGHVPSLVVEGEWEEADSLAHATRALGYGAMYGAVSLRALATLGLERGDTDLAWAMLREGLPHGMHTVLGDALFWNAVHLHRVAATLCIRTGDLSAARSWLETHDRWMEWSGAVPGRAEGALGWSAYHRAAGDAARARECAEAALASASAPRQPLPLLAAHRALGELEAIAGGLDAARAHLERAFALADACAAPYERALTGLAAAEHALVTGDLPSARTRLEQARAGLAALDAKPALARADVLAERLGYAASATPMYPAGLSAREVEVLRLLAQGRSNREIADALFLSVHTVHVHVRNILTKTNTANRTQAATFARDRGVS